MVFTTFTGSISIPMNTRGFMTGEGKHCTESEGAGMSTFGDCPKQNIYEDICYQKEQSNIPKVELMTMLAEIIAYIGENLE